MMKVVEDRSRVKIPKKQHGTGFSENPDSAAYKIRNMKADGPSLFFPGGNQGQVSAYARKFLGAGNYCTRKMEGGVRLWRTD